MRPMIAKAKTGARAYLKVAQEPYKEEARIMFAVLENIELQPHTRQLDDDKDDLKVLSYRIPIAQELEYGLRCIK